MNLPDSEYKCHYCFDAAEKFLLPRLLRRPEQVHFVNCLKFDINGLCTSKEVLNYIFDPVEGHRPGEKPANGVLPLLDHVLNLPGEARSAGGELFLTADNCAGQNENRFVSWYLC